MLDAAESLNVAGNTSAVAFGRAAPALLADRTAETYGDNQIPRCKRPADHKKLGGDVRVAGDRRAPPVTVQNPVHCTSPGLAPRGVDLGARGQGDEAHRRLTPQASE